MKQRRPDETDESYIKRLEASNADLRFQGKWAERTSRALSVLSTEASVAFQLMAEKAGVRSHPSVSKTVELFDAIAHPQWTPEDQCFAGIKFPDDWDLDPPGTWSGDADMQFNAPISAVIEYLKAKRWKVGLEEGEHIEKLISDLDRPLQGIVDSVMPERQRPPVDIPEDATREQLIEAINEIAFAAMDLAQDFAFSNDLLRRDLRAAFYRSTLHRLAEIGRIHIPTQQTRDEEGIPF